jgi:hypothetical protein
MNETQKLATSKKNLRTTALERYTYGILSIEYLIQHGQHRKHPILQVFYFYMCIRCRRKVSSEPLPRNVRGNTESKVTS